MINDKGYINPDLLYESGDGYIRFSDGTQICWGNAPTNARQNANIVLGSRIDFAKGFISTPRISLTIAYSENSLGDCDIIVNANRVDKNGMTPVRKSYAGVFKSDYVYTGPYWDNDYIAIGKWK